jgi:hypothetical protein
MKIKRHVYPLLIAVLVAAAPLFGGQMIGDPFGLTSPAVSITFTEFGIAGNTELTDQYASLGVTFPGGVYQDSGAVTNFLTSPTLVVTNPFYVDFTSPRTSAALQFATNTGTSTFTALSHGVAVDSFSFAMGGSALYYGFFDENFDEIRIDVDALLNVGVIINAQLGPTAVPEPSAFALLGGSLMALLGWRRYRGA